MNLKGASVFLHIGNNKNIRERDIIGIFDTDNATVSDITRKYLSNAEKHGRVSAASDEIPKSFVLYRNGDSTAVCFSQISSTALVGRKEIQ